MKDVIAVYPGTFDPITFGHMDIIKRASKMFKTVIVAVAQDSKKTTLLNVSERKSLIESELANNNLTNIKVMSFKGLLIEFAKSCGSTVIVRGLRAAADFEYEFQMAYINHKLSSEIQTIFIPANENGHYISSTFAKEVLRLGGDVSTLISKNVISKLKEKFNL